MGQGLTDKELDRLKNRFIRKAPKVSGSAAPQAHSQPGFLDEVQRGLARGVVSGPSSIVDLIGLGTQAGLETSGLDPKHRLPSATEAAENLGLPKVSTAAGRIAEGISGGAVLTPFAPGVGATVGGVGAAAIEVAKQFTDDPIILAGAGLAGGVSANSLANTVKAGTRVAASLQPTMRRRILKGQMERLLAGHIPDVDVAIKNAQEAQQLGQAIPGFQPALAEVVPATQQASRILRQSDSIIAAAQNKRLTGNVEALVKKAEDLGKTLPSGTPDSARRALHHRDEVLREVEHARQAKVHTAFDEALLPIRQEVGDIPDTIGFGQTLRTTVKDAFEKEKATFDQRYSELELNIQVDPMPSVRALEALEAGVKKAEVRDLPDVFIRDVIRNLGRKKPAGLPIKGSLGPRGTETLGELRAVRSSLLSERMAEKAKPAPDANKLRLLNQLFDGVQQNIDDAIGQTQNAALKQLNADYRDFNLRFNTGPIDDVLALSRSGGPKKSDVDLFNALTSTAGGKGLEHFRALQSTVGDGPARALYGQAMMSRLMQQTRKPDGTFDPQRVQRFIGAHEDIIQELPSVNARFQSIFRAARGVTELKQAPRTLADFDNTYARALMGDDPSKAITKLVKSGNMDEGLQLMTAAFGTEPAAFRAISRPMWKTLLEQAKVTAPSETTFAALEHKAMGALLQRNKAALQRFYGPEAYDGLVKIQQAARLNAEAPIGLQAGLSIEKSNFAGLLKTMWSRAFGIARGVIGPQFTSAEVFSRRVANLIDAFDEREIRTIMDNLLHDPDLMTTLTKAKNIRETLETQRGLKRWVKLNVAPTIAPIAQEQDRRTSATIAP